MWARAPAAPQRLILCPLPGKSESYRYPFRLRLRPGPETHRL
jgi:hypothetical protein